MRESATNNYVENILGAYLCTLTRDSGPVERITVNTPY